jgi:hypothetical protein
MDNQMAFFYYNLDSEVAFTIESSTSMLGDGHGSAQEMVIAWSPKSLGSDLIPCQLSSHRVPPNTNNKSISNNNSNNTSQ